MDISAPLLSNYSVGVQYHWSYPSSDSEFYNLSSPETCIISPTSCMDFSLSWLPRGTATGPHRSTYSGGAKASASPSSSDEGRLSGGRIRKNCSKNPSKQRQSASEKEKLRMRDLTKALHHLRTYLPPSVAPPEQTLTKIETLRLTISYISHLSAQLGLSEDTPCLKRKMDFTPCQYSQDMPQCPQGSSMSGQWCQEILQGNIQSNNQYCLPLATSYTNNTEPHMETDYLMPDVSYQDMSLYHNQVFQ